MLPALNEPVHLIDTEGNGAPGIVVPAQRGHAVAVRIDDGPSAQVGSEAALSWNIGADVFQVSVLVKSRRLVDGVPAVDLEVRGEVERVQRRRFVRVPVQRQVEVVLDPLPLDPERYDDPVRANGLTLDIAEASICCSLAERVAGAFTIGTGVRIAFELDSASYDLPGRISQVRHVTDNEIPRAELVIMLDVEEPDRTAIRRALYAEQIRMRALRE